MPGQHSLQVSRLPYQELMCEKFLSGRTPYFDQGTNLCTGPRTLPVNRFAPGTVRWKALDLPFLSKEQ